MNSNFIYLRIPRYNQCALVAGQWRIEGDAFIAWYTREQLRMLLFITAPTIRDYARAARGK